jgi:HPt (histidine-containing phosphotransfer) domain-containing protein
VAANRGVNTFLHRQLAPPAGLSLLFYLRNAEVQEALVHLLEPFGNRITRADGMADAVGRAGKETFDAILCGAGDADMLAAAPGVTAPLIAVLLRGDRAPAATDSVLRWPVEADALYGALSHFTHRHADGASAEPERVAAIDAVAFSTLEKSVGVKALVDILQCYIATAEELTQALADAFAAEKWDEASRLAQDIVGAAGGLGLTAVTQAARLFTQKSREGESRHELRNVAQMVMGEHLRAKQALSHLYPDVS